MRAAGGLHWGHTRLLEVRLTACAGWAIPVLGVNQDNALELGEEETETTCACQTYSCHHHAGCFKQMSWSIALAGVAGHFILGGV